MVGSAILRTLHRKGFGNLILKTSEELDLKNQQDVYNFFKVERPDYVFLAAAKVGGIVANNSQRADFLYENLMIQNNIIHYAYMFGVTKLLFLGSSCVYPKLSKQPIKEEYLLTGLLEATNEPYAIAKIAGIKLCETYRAQYGCNFISVMPTNLFGPNDNYNLKNSHVLPALLRKIITAKREGSNSVSIWGSGTPKREFLYVDDLADACLFLMNHYNESTPINIGTGSDITILRLTELIKEIVDFDGEIMLDKNKPDGTPRKLLDISKLSNLGWKASISLEDGIRRVYDNIKDVYWD